MQECPDETTSVKTSWLQSIFYFSFVTLPKTATLSRSHFFSRPYSGPTCTGENVVKGRIFTVCIFLKWFVQAFISGIFFVDVSISFETTSGEFGVCSTSLIQLWENNGPISPFEGTRKQKLPHLDQNTLSFLFSNTKWLYDNFENLFPSWDLSLSLVLL